MHVLVVEDDVALGAYLQKTMQLSDHIVDWVGDGEAALDYIACSMPDLMVLDLSLPRRDGMEVLKSVRAISEEIAVLILTGRSSMQDRLTCLNFGADDLMQKPFCLEELLARCRNAQRRRSMAEVNPVLRCGGLELYRIDRRVCWNKIDVELTTKEYALLEYLMLHRGRCVERVELLREVWAMTPDAGTNVVDVYVNYLRRKLYAADGNKEAFCPIETIRGKGYRINDAPKKLSVSVMPSGLLSTPRVAFT